jgi:hypothetical protein
MQTATTNELVEITPEGKLRLHFHHGQWQAWHSSRRIVGVIAGTQSGKTVFGSPWLHREIQQRGPGDYMVVTPTFPLLELKALPEFRRYFEDILALGTYRASPVRIFNFSESGQLRTFGNSGYDYRTNVFFGYAAEPESLESATAKAAWLDEAGQKRFKVDSWEAIRRRLSIHRGRVLITTTPYNLGWLKQRVWDKWKEGDPNIDVIRFVSITNPLFSREEWDDARRNLPRWKFDMFYRAIFTRPAGLIYDVFDETRHRIPRGQITVQDDWPRYLGLDFGGVNTVGLFYAQIPGTSKLYLYREYKAGGRTAREHVEHLLEGEPVVPFCVGGSRSEGQWRREFLAAGLRVRGPAVTDVEVGIDRVYGRHKADEILVSGDCTGYLDEKLTYSRVLDENGEPTEEIEDKSEFHFMDAERYVLGWLTRPRQQQGGGRSHSSRSLR